MSTPGWYNDEDDDRLARWHDGKAWTEHTLVKAEWAGLGMPPSPVGQPPLRAYRPVEARRSLPTPPPMWVPVVIAVVALVLAVVGTR